MTPKCGEMRQAKRLAADKKPLKNIGLGCGTDHAFLRYKNRGMIA
jgi:hypothetical protein